MERTRKWLRIFLGFAFVVAGVLHFIQTDVFAAIVPPYLPAPALLVLISGAFEVLGGMGLLLSQPWQRWAAYGLVLLLLVVFPANIHMALYPDAVPGISIAPWILWLRLPLQFVLIGAVLWSVRVPSSTLADAR